MKRRALLLSFVAFFLVFVSFASGQDVHYLGKFSDREAGMIRISGQNYEVSEGTVIPELGTVKQITNTYLILHKTLSDEEKEELAFQGAATYDILEIRLPHEEFRVVSVP